jgi:hypothetical protein
LNVSLQHYDPVHNNDLLKARSRHDRVAFLTRMLSAPEFAVKTRVSLNLMTGGVDNRVDLVRFLDTLSGMGCQHVKLNELQGAGEDYVSYESIMGVRLPSPFAHGCQTDLPAHAGMRVTLKRSCFIVEPSLQASAVDTLKVMRKAVLRQAPSGTGGVLYENGCLESGWLTA